VDYTTRNGTAMAGSDYIAVSGKLNLYPGENQAVIPVEIVGDTVPEPSETFFVWTYLTQWVVVLGKEWSSSRRCERFSMTME
jgi:hypothetical protein